jgi:hypothetical protein
MKTMKKMLLVMGLVLVAFAVPVYADSVNFNAGTTYQTTALTGYQTFGDMMVGMKVTAGFGDGSSETRYWAVMDIPSRTGGASGNGWSLTEVGDTFDGSGVWTLTNNLNFGLISLAIDAGLGDSVFDTQAVGDVFGTNGSARGWDFIRTSALGELNVTANYWDHVALTGFAPVGDLFRNLSLDIDSGGLYGMMTFQQDTDNLKYSGDITPAPEPATLLLLGFGLAGLAGVGRKFKK